VKIENEASIVVPLYLSGAPVKANKPLFKQSQKMQNQCETNGNKNYTDAAQSETYVTFRQTSADKRMVH
jgi:hypothetical protein